MSETTNPASESASPQSAPANSAATAPVAEATPAPAPTSEAPASAAPVKEEHAPAPPSALKIKITQFLKTLKAVTGQLASILRDIKSFPKKVAALPKLFFGFLLGVPKLFLIGDLRTKILVLGLLLSGALILLTGTHFLTKIAEKMPKEIHIELPVHKLTPDEQAAIESKSLVFLKPFEVPVDSRFSMQKTLEAEVVLQAANPEMTAILKANLGFLQEAISAILQTKKYEDLAADKDRTSLKKQIKDELGALLKKQHINAEIRDVHFVKFVMS